jgi:Co/Zn/Cd efflux system component
MAHSHVGARPLAAIEDPGAHAGFAGRVVQQFGAAEPGGEVRDSIRRTAVYVTRKHGDMRSVWLCSRNDLIANLSVLLAAWAVWITVSPWPDLAVGALICALFLRSARIVAREAREEMRNHAEPPAAAGRKRRAP